jgi:pimeloyl-ACP methyl ester carboxylesterase
MSRTFRRRFAPLFVLAVAVLVAAPGSALAKKSHHHWHGGGQKLDWQTCDGDAGTNGWQCATYTVPKDYRNPHAGTFDLAVTRLPAADPKQRVGSLFVNYGGPGGDAVSTTQAIGDILFGAFHDKFDIVAFDPRGVGQSSEAIDCKANQETEGVYSQPYMTPDFDYGEYLKRVIGYVNKCKSLNKDVLPYVSTANVATDMNGLRRAVGDKKLTYFGFSYGTYLGSTYATLFPHKTRALVLDGAVDVDQYATDPMGELIAQTGAFERALDRFAAACDKAPDYCTFSSYNGGLDSLDAFDELVKAANANPIPAPNSADPRPVDGEDILQGVLVDLYAKQAWPEIAQALNGAAAGDASLMRDLVDSAYGNNLDGTFDPGSDRYFTISAIDAYGDYSNDPRDYLKPGYRSWSTFPHFWWNTGYVEVNWGLLNVRPRGVFYGPFRVPADAATPLVVGTTYDPATPYRGAVRTTKELGNARLLTMRGDGHTAYFGNSQCIDDAINAYVNDLVLPAEGTTCKQEVPFPPPPEATAARSATAKAAKAGVVRRFQGRGTAPIAAR